MNAKELVSLIISNTASQYSEEWKPDRVYTKDELIELLESYAQSLPTEQSQVSDEEIEKEFPTVGGYPAQTVQINTANYFKQIGAKWMRGLRGLKQEGWISVEDRLPDFTKMVITFGDLGVSTCLRDSPHWKQTNVIHWQPLPEPPNNNTQ